MKSRMNIRGNSTAVNRPPRINPLSGKYRTIRQRQYQQLRAQRKNDTASPQSAGKRVGSAGHQTESDALSDFMNGVSIGQVRPVVKKGQAYVPKPPRLMTDTIRSEYGCNSAGLSKGHKSDRRPVSGFQNAGTKRKIAKNAADLKDFCHMLCGKSVEIR